MKDFEQPVARAAFDPDGRGSGGGGGGQTDIQMVVRHLENLKIWGAANKRDARRDFRRFWAFKIPAIVSSVATAASAALGWSEQLISIMAAAAAISVAVDGFWPGGLLHNVHLRAVHDIGLLGGKVQTSLDKIEIEHSSEGEARQSAFIKILDEIGTERQRIGEYLASAESSLGVERQ